MNEAVQQVAFSDRILLNKVDLVTPEELAAIRETIVSINGFAEILTCERSKADLSKLIGISSFNIERCTELDPVLFSDAEGTTKVHDLSMVSSVGISASTSGVSSNFPKIGNSLSLFQDTQRLLLRFWQIDGYLDVPKFNMFMAELLQTRAADLYRTKGVLSFAGQGDQKFVFQGVHEQIDFGPALTKWKPDEERVSKIVFIGRNLDRKTLTDAITACLDPTATC